MWQAWTITGVKGVYVVELMDRLCLDIKIISYSPSGLKLCNLNIKGKAPVLLFPNFKLNLRYKKKSRMTNCLEGYSKCGSLYLTALTEHQLQLAYFEKPKLPYPLRRYLLTQHCKPGMDVDDWHMTAAAAELQSWTFIPISSHSCLHAKWHN